MADPEDIVDIPGLRRAEATHAQPSGPQRRFLSVWFRCCHTYGRLNRNQSQTAYVGRCPRCGCHVQALIGPDGSTRRIFEAR